MTKVPLPRTIAPSATATNPPVSGGIRHGDHDRLESAITIGWARRSPSLECAWSKWKRRVVQISGIENFTLHDIRRSVATKMNELKIPENIVEHVLNHSTKTQMGVGGVYNRYKFVDEKQEALETWAGEIQRLILHYE